MADHDYDVVVIGSGFGGAVLSCRLAQANYKVLVLEQGWRWQPPEFPHKHLPPNAKVRDYPEAVTDGFFWDEGDILNVNGLNDIRTWLGDTSVVQGIGVGGGSLHYAGVTLRPPTDIFDKGWPKEINYDELVPYLDAVGKMIGESPVPENQLPEKTKVIRKSMEDAGFRDRFNLANLSFSFDPDWQPIIDGEDGRQTKFTKRFTNDQGIEQGTCVHLGNCYGVGCNVDAKNSLNLNYIPLAEQAGAEVRPLHKARIIEPLSGGGYTVTYDQIDTENKEYIPGSVTSKLVILSAGSLNSTEILLRCRDIHKTLPNLSKWLGHFWSGNGDFGGLVLFPKRKVYPRHGPSITTMTDFDTIPLYGEHFITEEVGVLQIFADASTAKHRDKHGIMAKAIIKGLEEMAESVGIDGVLEDILDHFMVWGALGRDAANGRLSLRRKWCGLFGEKVLNLHWSPKKSQKLYDAMTKTLSSTIKEVGGIYFENPLASILKTLLSLHPLGGVPMGDPPGQGTAWTQSDGIKRNTDQAVVDHKGEVFGYKDLFVVDSSIMPISLSRNPSMTIAAFAERTAKLIINEKRI